MSSSSPEWLRSYQEPSRSVVTLSSDSESFHRDKSLSDDEYLPDVKKTIASDFSLSPEEDEDKRYTLDHTEATSSIKEYTKIPLNAESSDSRIYTKRRKLDKKSKEKSAEGKTVEEDSAQQHVEIQQKADILPALKSKVTVPKDDPKKLTENSPMQKQKTVYQTEGDGESISNVKGEDSNVGVPGEEVEMHAEPLVCSTTMPLILPEKIQRYKALVECEGDSIDMSGDMGAVGRVMISDTPTGHEMFLDLKGTMYKTTIVPSRTFCIVNFGQSEAKIEAIMNDFIQLKPQSNAFHAETMVEGTLDGFSFDSEDEAEPIPKAANNKDENNDTEQVNGKGKGKLKSDKQLGKTQKKGKTAVGKPQKKVRKKTQTPKKARSKK